MSGFKLSKTWYYIISLTWGLPITLIGLAAAAILLVFGCTPYENSYGWYFQVGRNWGGVNLGIVSIVNKTPSEHTLQHEFGHSIQNCIFGIFFIPFVAIPSMIRYWYRIYLTCIKKISYSELPDYDYAWYEGMATMFGKRYS